MHWLLTVLGTSLQSACYVLADRSAQAELAPLALLALLPQETRPAGVLAVCTPQAKRDTYPRLRAGLQAEFPALRVVPVDVPTGEAQADLAEFLARLSAAIPTEEETILTVDVTHGFRHFSFLTYAAVLYLSALRGVRVRGAYYGLLRREGPSPFLNLGPLLELPRWVHALQVLDDTGNATPTARLLRAAPDPSANHLAGHLEQVSDAHASGLPLELGRAAAELLSDLRPLERLLRRRDLPLHHELIEKLRSLLRPLALHPLPGGPGWKNRIALSGAELERQKRLIDDLLARDHRAAALGLMREWTVSWVLWRLGATDDWLDSRDARRRAEGLLGAMSGLVRAGDIPDALSEEQRALGLFWADLCPLRNAYHHHGMSKQPLDSDTGPALARVSEYWHKLLCRCPETEVKLRIRTGRLVVSPLGKAAGVLFSALRAGSQRGVVDACLVVCAEETEAGVGPAAVAAGYTGTPVALRVADPYGGLTEIGRIVREARPHLVAAEEVLVNITGGTTLLGLCASAVADEARRLARPVRRFGLIDRRPPEEQRQNPYQPAEAYWLDGEEDSDGADD